jgi:hypothetical protein
MGVGRFLAAHEGIEQEQRRMCVFRRLRVLVRKVARMLEEAGKQEKAGRKRG